MRYRYAEPASFETLGSRDQMPFSRRKGEPSGWSVSGGLIGQIRGTTLLAIGNFRLLCVNPHACPMTAYSAADASHANRPKLPSVTVSPELSVTDEARAAMRSGAINSLVDSSGVASIVNPFYSNRICAYRTICPGWIVASRTLHPNARSERSSKSPRAPPRSAR